MKKSFGFTLAEVLITLGIIGIVAAMTMPSLIAHHKKRVVETRLQKFYSVLNQAIIMSEKDNGEKENWDSVSNTFTREDWYKKYLAEYLNTVKIEVNENLNTQNNKAINIYFADGSMAVMGATTLFYPEAKKYKFKSFGDAESDTYVDTSTSGKDWFTFNFRPDSSDPYHRNKGMEPYLIGWDGTQEGLMNNPTVGCRKNLSGTQERAFCTAVIMQNGWKIPDDYPIGF